MVVKANMTDEIPVAARRVYALENLLKNDRDNNSRPDNSGTN